jgi:PAS domain S-box-containing protein
MSESLKVLLVDDDEDYFVITRDLLRDAGRGDYTLDWSATFDDGCEAMVRNAHHVCMLDYRLGNGPNGLELLRAARSGGCQTPVILFTGTGDHQIDVDAMQAGAVDYLDKDGVTAPILERAIRYAIDRTRKDAALRKSREDMLAILNQMRMGIVMTDRAGRLTFLSQSCYAMLEAEPGALEGRSWRVVCPFGDDDKRRLDQMMNKPADQRANVAVHFQTPSGHQRWMEVEVHDDPREPRRKILFLYDVTEVHDLRQQLHKKARFHDLVGRCEPMRDLYRMIADLAKVDSTVLIEGETGTGKELVARAIHFSSTRKDKPFVAVNCAGLTESLLGSQLFGHKRGAFTGAVEDHRGVFETAEGGTIFLDEVGDVSPGVQSSLLRVLQEKEITRLGDTEPRKINVRILAATHRDLAAMVADSAFRQDLLYRIRVARVTLPPLRDRRSDIPLLAESFLRKLRATTGKQVARLSPEAMGLLLNHRWPGNVRELQSAIEFAMIRAKLDWIAADDLPPELVQPVEPVAPLPESEDEELRVREALRLSRGNRVAAAKMLGVSRSTLYRRLDELGIEDG